MEKEERKMETLYAKKALAVGLVYSALVCIPSALLAAYFFGRGKPGGGILYITILLFGGYAGVYKGVKIYRTHWIKYGDGKVIIRRISKDRANGKPTGKWRNREDEFLLGEIDSYGMSWQILGEFVEYHLDSRRGTMSECFFRLKNERKIGYETLYYDPGEEEKFFRYISEKTGIEFQETAKLMLKTGKASEPAKAERD